MASSLIHGFKAPLTLIQGFVDLLGDPETPVERRQKYSRLIQEEVQGFLTSAQGLLEYAPGRSVLTPKKSNLMNGSIPSRTSCGKTCPKPGSSCRPNLSSVERSV